MSLDRLKKAADQFVEETAQDFTEAQSSAVRLIPEGYAFARLVEYIELGKHAGEYDKKPIPPALMFRLGFALFPSGEDEEGYSYEDGSPRIIRTFDINLSLTEKSKAFKLFKKMNFKGVYKHFAQMIGEPFLLNVIHVDKKSGGGKSARIDLEGFLPPIDVVTRKPHQIPKAPDDCYRMFLWDRPTKEDWDSLFVEGKWDNGDSKNYVQEKILEATDFEGSPLHQLLEGSNKKKVHKSVTETTVPDLPGDLEDDIPY